MYCNETNAQLSKENLLIYYDLLKMIIDMFNKISSKVDTESERVLKI